MSTHITLIVVISAMCLAMVASLPRKVPAKVNRAIGVRFTKVVEMRGRQAA